MSSGADNAVLSKCFATLEKKPKCGQGKTECTSFYLFVLLSPKMIRWRLRCSKEYMYIYRYIYTTILYMYMYIYLYHLSCEPNHVIKPIFHLSVKSKCYPTLHMTSDLKTREKVVLRRLSLAGSQARLPRWSPNSPTPQSAQRHPPVASRRSWREWPPLQDGDHRRPPPALLAVLSGGGGEGRRRVVSEQPENVTERTWKEAKYDPCVVRWRTTAQGRMEVRRDEPLLSFHPAINELHGQLA